jgi:hypothetical protein
VVILRPILRAYNDDASAQLHSARPYQTKKTTLRALLQRDLVSLPLPCNYLKKKLTSIKTVHHPLLPASACLLQDKTQLPYLPYLPSSCNLQRWVDSSKSQLTIGVLGLVASQTPCSGLDSTTLSTRNDDFQYRPNASGFSQKSASLREKDLDVKFKKGDHLLDFIGNVTQYFTRTGLDMIT